MHDAAIHGPIRSLDAEVAAPGLLVTGRGTSGSWRIRGEQLGRAVGAVVLPEAREVAAHDLAIVVKRPSPDVVHRLRVADVPWVWDVVDAWPQPRGNTWDQREAMIWLQDQLAFWHPAAVVAATRAMADDVRRVFRGPVLALPHHARPGALRNPIRQHLRRVGYQGGAQYIDRWARVLARECRARDLEWVPEVESLADVDIVVALRDQIGYPARRWKSNVKLANAQLTGTPVICAREAGYVETCPSGGVLWADNESELCGALDALRPAAARTAASLKLLKDAPTLAHAATTLREWLLSEVIHGRP